MPGEFDFDGDVAARLHDLKVQREAKHQLDQELWAPPEWPTSAYEQLAEEPPEVDWILCDLWAGNGQINAQRKAGKTTLMLNAARSLVTREPFLRRFDVNVGPDCRVLYFNMELTKGQFNKWLKDMEVPDEALKRLVVYHSREHGRLDFNSDAVVEWLATAMRYNGIEIALLDPLGSFYDQPNGDPNAAYLRWWGRLEDVVREANLRGVLIAHHAGYSEDAANRARGASAMMDKPDVNLTLRYNVGEGSYTDAPIDNRRYLSAFGRDVDVKEFELDYNMRTRKMYATGGGNRADAEMIREAGRAWEAVLLTEQKGEKPNKGELFEKLGWPMTGTGAAKVNRWYRYALQQEWITADASGGKGKAILHMKGRRTPHENWKQNLRNPATEGDGDG